MRRSLPLVYLLGAAAILLGGISTLVLGLVFATQVKIASLAVDTRDRVLPVIVSQQELARDVERLILFGEALLNSADPQKRRLARLGAQTLVYNEPAFRANSKMQKLGGRTLTTLAELALQHNRRDALDEQAFALMLRVGAVAARPGSRPEADRAIDGFLVRTVSADNTAALELAERDIKAARASRLITLSGDTLAEVDRLIATRREIIAIDQRNAATWDDMTRQLKSVTDTLATQAQLETRDRFSEIQEQARLVTQVGIGGLVFLVAVLVAFAFLAHRYFIRPLVQATRILERARAGEGVLQEANSPIAEIGSIMSAAGTLIEKTRAIAEERQRVLSARAEVAEAANRSKSIFLSTISHELRTPMNGVLGMAQLLHYTEMSEEQRHDVDAIISSAKSLLSIIDDILEFVAAEDGYMRFDAAPFALPAFLQSICARHGEAAALKSNPLRLELGAALPATSCLDQGRLAKVLDILIENAIEFTRHGEIVVGAAMGADGELRLEVRDSGIGMEPAVVRQLFQPFYQADSTITRHHGGIGLGLALADRIVKGLGGSISVSSTPHVGSRFVVAIPLPLPLEQPLGQPLEPPLLATA